MELVERAMVGDLEVRGEESAFEGNFKGIVSAITRSWTSWSATSTRCRPPALIVDRDFTIHFINAAGADVAGESASQIKGKKCYELFHAGDCQTERCALARCMASGKRESSETDDHPRGMDLLISYSGRADPRRRGEIIGASSWSPTRPP